MVAVRPRRWGLWLLTLGLMLMLLPGATGLHSIGGWSPRFLGLIAGALSLPLLTISVILKRRYHRQRYHGIHQKV
jgi:branched-subunit amino acid permease